MKKIIALFVVLVSVSAVSNEVQLNIRVVKKKCAEMISHSIRTSNTYMIEGHSYREYEFNEDFRCYKLTKEKREFFADYNPAKCFCKGTVSLLN